MMVPVIKVKTVTGRMDTGMVNVEISSFLSRITNIEFKLDFMQMEPVTDKLKPRKLVAFFVDSENRKISFDVPMIANSREKDASKRIMNEKFTLKSDNYVSSIDEQGLIPKSRLYVHLSSDMETARKVGSRHGKPVIYEIDCRKMSEDGYSFFLSANKVWLTKEVPVKYLKKL